MRLHRRPSSDHRRVETETDAVGRFEVDLRIRFEVLSEFGNENVHASAEKVVVLTPDIEEHFFPFQDAVRMFAKEFEQVRLLLGQIKELLAAPQLQVCIGEI